VCELMSAPKNKLKKILDTGFNFIEKKRTNFMRKKNEMNDRFENRQFLGDDKYGNQYFQYFSYHGLPTRRRVYYNFFGTNKFHIDVHFIDWLFQRTTLPPTRDELRQLYVEDDSRHRKALEWDQGEEAKQLAYKEKLRKLSTDPETYMLETNEQHNNQEGVNLESYKPIPWVAAAKDIKELRKYHPTEEVTERVISIEQGIIEEHEKYQAYLKSKGRDLDKIAKSKMMVQVSKVRYDYEEMQKFSYLFEGIDTSRETIPLSELNKKPTYLDPYLNRHEIYLKEKELERKQILEEIRTNESKQKRYHDFKRKFPDVFDPNYSKTYHPIPF